MAVQVYIYVNYNFFVAGYASGCHENLKPENHPQFTKNSIRLIQAVHSTGHCRVTGRLLMDLYGGMAGILRMVEVVLVVGSLMGLCSLYINGQESVVSSHSPGQTIYLAESRLAP